MMNVCARACVLSAKGSLSGKAPNP